VVSSPRGSRKIVRSPPTATTAWRSLVELSRCGSWPSFSASAMAPRVASVAPQYRGQDAVTICFFGDGATNIGYFHEALNLAAVWDLPVLWICENNQYGMGTSVGRASAIEEIHHKAEAYNTPHARVDGMDIRMVYEAAQEALAHAREKGPFFLEAVTYRFEGHSVGDPERYRTKEEIGRWEENDPIGIYRRHLPG